MSWLSGSELTSGWTSSNYPGFGILFENLPTTGESGGSPLLNDGGVNGDEVRWELLTQTDLTVNAFYEDGSFESTGTGSFTYRSFVNNSTVGDFTVNVTPESAGTAYTITCDAVSDSHQAGAILLNRGYTISIDSVSDTHSVGDVTLIAGPIDYTLTCDAVIDTHSAGNVILRYALPSDPIDYGMSGFGHNRQWRNSIFFRGQ